MIKSIDNVGIAASDLSRSIAFYEQIGFTKGDEYDDEGLQGCSMTAGSAVLFLFQSQRADAPPVGRESTLVNNPPGVDHVSLLVEDVDAAYTELRANGVAFDGEPADQWGLRIVGLKDPDGNNLYLLHYPQ